MKNLSIALGLLASGFLSPAAFADPFVGTDAALIARDSLVEEFAAGKPAAVAAEAVLNRIVDANLDALAREGHGDLAARHREIWERRFAKSLTRRLSAMGDHDPLSLYLVDLYEVLSKTLGEKSKYAAILKDLNSMNFAIPVVFAPRGDWRTKKDSRADRAEYGVHFVPFAGILTYYASLSACQQAAASKGLGKLGKMLCPKIALRLEAEMSKRLAPKLADYIFNRANGTSALLRLTKRDFLYLEARELEAALR